MLIFESLYEGTLFIILLLFTYLLNKPAIVSEIPHPIITKLILSPSELEGSPSSIF